MTALTTAPALDRPSAAPHIVDVLIAERAPKLAASAAWPLLRPLLYALLDYRKARRLADQVAPMGGRAALDLVSAMLDVQVEVTGLEHVPSEGRLICVCNHPTGLADGIAVYDPLKAVRPDLMFYANADAHRVAPAFGEVLIPVEWVEAKRTRERTRRTLELTRQALEAERCLVVFPSGRLARRDAAGRLVDPAWMPTAVSLARKYDAPIVPMHLSGPASRLFHAFHRVSAELRDITLFHEMLNKKGQAYRLIVGPPVEPGRLEGNAAEATAALKIHVEAILPNSPKEPFR